MAVTCRATYYEALEASTRGRQDGAHSIWPWITYLLGVFQNAYSPLDRRLDTLAEGPGATTRAVKEFIRNRAVAEFSIDDIRNATPAGDNLIRKVLAELTRDGAIEIARRGRHARYRRLTTDV